MENITSIPTNGDFKSMSLEQKIVAGKIVSQPQVNGGVV
jgi:hypothetical protein